MCRMKNNVKQVAVLMGGPSSEREVSLRSGAAIASALREAGHCTHEVVVGRDCSFALPAGVDAAFIALHGHFGEDGGVQRELERLGIPYTGSRPEACAHAFDKIRSKQTFFEHAIPTAACVYFSRPTSGADFPPPPLPLPFVVKAARQGSSTGVWRVFQEAEWRPALTAAFDMGDDALVEAFIAGRELTVGIVNGTVLPVLEIFAPDGDYDYHAKYTPGASSHAPAVLVPAVESACREIARRVAEVLDCLALARVDFRLADDGSLFVLELNNIPGFTETSLLPDAAKAYGWSFSELCARILSAAREGS